MFCLLVVLAKLSLLAKWLARKTPLRKPNRGKGIVSRKPRLKSAHDFLGLLYCFNVLLCICVVSCPYVIYYPTVMARYSLFVLKVPLNPKQTMLLYDDCLCSGGNGRHGWWGVFKREGCATWSEWPCCLDSVKWSSLNAVVILCELHQCLPLCSFPLDTLCT